MKQKILLVILVLFGFEMTLAAPYTPPVPEQFKGWTFDPSYQAEGKDLKNLNKVSIQCQDKTLIPTHPQQDTKAYHLAVVGTYGKSLMRGGPQGKYGAVCRVWSRNSDPEKQSCLAMRMLHLIVLSDLYQDRCGNIYRGYFQKTFFSDEESMGTLVSPGKTFYENPYSQFRGTSFVETYVGGTYAIDASRFLYFSRASEQDILEVRKNIQSGAAQGQFQDPETGLFNDAIPRR